MVKNIRKHNATINYLDTESKRIQVQIARMGEEYPCLVNNKTHIDKDGKCKCLTTLSEKSLIYNNHLIRLRSVQEAMRKENKEFQEAGGTIMLPTGRSEPNRVIYPQDNVCRHMTIKVLTRTDRPELAVDHYIMLCEKCKLEFEIADVRATIRQNIWNDVEIVGSENLPWHRVHATVMNMIDNPLLIAGRKEKGNADAPIVRTTEQPSSPNAVGTTSNNNA